MNCTLDLNVEISHIRELVFWFRIWIFTFIHRIHNRSVDVLLSTSGYIVKIWTFDWSPHVLLVIYFFIFILKSNPSRLPLAEFGKIVVMNFLVSLGTCTCVSQRKAWIEEMNEEERPLDRYMCNSLLYRCYIYGWFILYSGCKI